MILLFLFLSLDRQIALMLQKKVYQAFQVLNPYFWVFVNEQNHKLDDGIKLQLYLVIANVQIEITLKQYKLISSVFQDSYLSLM